LLANDFGGEHHSVDDANADTATSPVVLRPQLGTGRDG
jgi:hypothetical protein